MINPPCTSFSSVAGNDSEYEILNSYLVYYELTKIYCALSLFWEIYVPLTYKESIELTSEGRSNVPQNQLIRYFGERRLSPVWPAVDFILTSNVDSYIQLLT